MNGPVGDRLLEIGEIKAVYGIKGWVKIFSYTRPIEQIFVYPKWFIGTAGNWQQIELEDSRQRSNSGLIAKFKNIDDRTLAQSFAGKNIAIEKTELTELESGEYYWSQLIGLQVINLKSETLGEVIEMIETGANDVLVVKNEQGQQLIPYDKSIVQEVRIDSQQILVDWEIDY